MKKYYYVYAYEHVDDNTMMLSLDEYKKKYVESVNYQEFDDHLQNDIKPLLRKAGWEGDGEIQMVWVPPFCMSGYYTMGVFVYHVKQKNNGTSFIYSTYELNNIKEFERDV